MNIKKIILSISLIILIAIGWVGYNVYKEHTGENYYIQLVNDPISCKNLNNGEVECQYKEKGYNDEGNERIMEFSSFRERPLKKDAYLVVTYNNIRKGVIKYKEVKKGEIPKKALEKLEKNKALK